MRDDGRAHRQGAPERETVGQVLHRGGAADGDAPLHALTPVPNDATAPQDNPPTLPAASAPPAWRCRRAWIVLLVATLLGLVADLVSKEIAFARVAGDPVVIHREDVLTLPSPAMIGSLLPYHAPVNVIPGVLDFRLVLNPGAVFGVGAGQRWFFVLFTTVALGVAVWVFATWTRGRDTAAHIGVACVLAGGLGNLYDRLKFACVRDFIHPLPGVNLPFGMAWPSGDRQIWPWVSNVADALLIVGIALLLIHLWRGEPAKQQATA
ncbi:MAG: signal peptidase II [Phycisphaerales bacterium]|nr:MAG: signal peptidase II [Phycisphaerales bacterium]